jgi:osmotically-inducible protein OsmY
MRWALIISRKQTDAALCGCAALLLAMFVPVPALAQDTTVPPAQTAPDNTAHNKDHAKTADQQSNNAADRDTTQQIRKSIVGDSSLSTYAHNVKIITLNGGVTLKGPVRSAEEKQSVEDKATAVAGAGKVKNQLSVKPESK